MFNFLGAVAVLVGILGYVMNIIKMFAHTGDWGFEMLVRVIGLIVPFIGAILGFIN